MAAPIKLLILEGEADITLSFIFSVKRSALIGDIHVIATEKSRVRYSRYIKSYQILVGKDDQDLVKLISLVQSQYKADVLVPIYEEQTSFVARNYGQLLKIIKIIPIPSLEQYENLSNKAFLSQVLKQKELPAPETLVFKNGPEFLDQLKNLKYPVLFKPSFSWGGRGIMKFSDFQSLQEYIEVNQFIDCSFIIQSYIDGYDIDCSVLYKDGKLKAWCVQKSFIDHQSYHMSPGIEFIKQREVIGLVDSLLSPLNYNGIAHIDLRFDSTDEKYKFIEINTRFWGTMLGSLITANINFPLLSVYEALEIPYEIKDFDEGCYMTFDKYFQQRFHAMFNDLKVPVTIRSTSFCQLASDPAPKLMFLVHYLINRLKIHQA